MKSSATAKNMFSSATVKSKRLSKDREKRKSQSAPQDKTESNNNGEKGSPSKDATRKYAGIGPDSIFCYSEQTAIEHLSNEVCYGFAEDLSYRLRFVMNDALIKARLCGRNVITSSDIDATFESLNIEKVYGAPTNPNWMQLPDHNLLYLDDQIVNLVVESEKKELYQQASDPVLIRRWLPEAKENNRIYRNYFEMICKAVLSNNQEIRQMALKDLRENCHIGPIVEWFYHFGYFLLSKDITYDCLTLSALELIKALEENCIAPQVVSERQLSLLVRLILQRLLRSVTTDEVLKPMCMILAILCDRVPLKDIVILKMMQKFSEIKENFSLPILSIINAIGYDALTSIFLPNLEYFISRAETQPTFQINNMLMQIYNLICKYQINTIRIDDLFYECYGETVITVWKPKEIVKKNLQEKEDRYWARVKVQLLRTRRRIIYYSANKKDPNVDQMFVSELKDYPPPVPIDWGDKDKRNKELFNSFQRGYLPHQKPLNVFKKIVIHPKRKVIRYNPPAKVDDIDLKHEFFHTDILMSSEIGNSKIKESIVDIGKRSLLLPVLQSKIHRSQASRNCSDHSLLHYIL